MPASRSGPDRRRPPPDRARHPATAADRRHRHRDVRRGVRARLRARRSAGRPVLVEGLSMSVVVFAGAAQFAAVGLLAQGVPWLGIVVLTALLNARHLLYSASLAPWFAGRSRQEAGALGIRAHGRGVRARAAGVPGPAAHDRTTYLIAAVFTFVPWVSATVRGHARSASCCRLPRPSASTSCSRRPWPGSRSRSWSTDGRSRRRSSGAALGVAVALVTSPSVGIVAGGLVGPAFALLVPETTARDRGGRDVGCRVGGPPMSIRR